MLACGPEKSLAADFRDWVALRDAGVIRQQEDYSCGLAALATLLTYDYGRAVSEPELLQRLLQRLPDRAEEVRAGGVSLQDLSVLAADYGYASAGVSITPEALLTLRWPAVAYLEVQGMPHFVVLRRVEADGAVQIADPSWGNRRLLAFRFAGQFFTASDGRGRLLLLPPPRQSRSADGRDHAPRLLPTSLGASLGPGVGWGAGIAGGGSAVRSLRGSSGTVPGTVPGTAPGTSPRIIPSESP